MSIFDYDLVGVIQHKSSNGQCTNPLIRFDPIRELAVGFVIAYLLLGHAVHCSRDDGQVLDRRRNPQVFGEEHRGFGNRNGRDFGSYERDSAGTRIREHLSVGERRDLPGELHDVVVGGHVLHGQVFSAVSHEHIALVFNKIRVRTVVQCCEFLDVGVRHVDAFH